MKKRKLGSEGPGTRHIQYLEENAEGADIQLPESAWSDLERALSSFDVDGARYPEAAMKMLDTPE